MSSDRFDGILTTLKPFLAVVLLQCGYSGLAILAKFALDLGMDQHVFVVYRHVVATIAIAPFALALERKTRPKMTVAIFVKIMILGLLEPVMDQNLFFTGMKYTSATFTSALANVLPAFAFVMAWIIGMETVNVRKLHSQAKIAGTIVTVGGATVMTLVKGTVIDLPWTRVGPASPAAGSDGTKQDPIKGAAMIMTGSICCAAFIILQARVIRSYPAELSLTAMICLMGSLEGSIFVVAVERGFHEAAWALHFDAVLLAALYAGIICSAVGYYTQGMVMKTKGPVFVTAFNPLGMVIVAILSSFILHETLYLGRVIGAAVIVVGLYMVLWGKSKDEPQPVVDKIGDRVSWTEDDLKSMVVSNTPGTEESVVHVTVEIAKVEPADDDSVQIWYSCASGTSFEAS